MDTVSIEPMDPDPEGLLGVEREPGDAFVFHWRPTHEARWTPVGRVHAPAGIGAMLSGPTGYVDLISPRPADIEIVKSQVCVTFELPDRQVKSLWFGKQEFAQACILADDGA